GLRRGGNSSLERSTLRVPGWPAVWRAHFERFAGSSGSSVGAVRSRLRAYLFLSRGARLSTTGQPGKAGRRMAPARKSDLRSGPPRAALQSAAEAPQVSRIDVGQIAVHTSQKFFTCLSRQWITSATLLYEC